MATATSSLFAETSSDKRADATMRISVKTLVESPGLTSLPSNYSYSKPLNETAASNPNEDIFPIIDFSLLTSDDPHQRSKAIQDLDDACQDWGFFMLVNHGVSEKVMKELLEGCKEFFDLPVEEKMEFAGRDIWQPIRFGTGVDVKDENIFFWRDFLKMIVHPQFHFPNKPNGFREAAREFVKSTREVTTELLKGISKSWGLEESYIEKATNFDTGFQLFAANLYPPCPQPENTIGIPPHTDHSLLTILIQNEIGGLQIQHKGEWFNVNPIPNSFLVNTGDHLQILSNWKYKSVSHRAVVNNSATRISIATSHGPALETAVAPAPELVDAEGGCPAAYMPMKFKDYLDRLYGAIPGNLDHVRFRVAK